MADVAVKKNAVVAEETGSNAEGAPEAPEKAPGAPRAPMTQKPSNFTGTVSCLVSRVGIAEKKFKQIETTQL